MTKIYTKTGDDGTTGIIGGGRVMKSGPRVIAYGAIDELNATIGVILSSEIDLDISKILSRIQNDLFVVGSDLANPDLSESSSRVAAEMVTFLENSIDELEHELDPITYFILPGGDLTSSYLHLARAVCRRAETNIVKLSESDSINKTCQIYINRLSDLLFVIARIINKRKKIKDIAWKK